MRKNNDDALHFSDLIRVDRGGLPSSLETTHRRLVEQLSTSWIRLVVCSNHRSCLIVSIARIADITLSCANILCTFIDRDPNDVAEKKKEEREKDRTLRKYQTVIYRLCQLRETKLIDALRKKCNEKK